MSESYEVIETYKAATKARRKRKYLLAARLYRLCAVYYENGELGEYNPDIQDYGMSASFEYEWCKNRLSKQKQEMLDNEALEYAPDATNTDLLYRWGMSNWYDFTKEEWEKIDPELTALEKASKCRLWEWLKGLFKKREE